MPCKYAGSARARATSLSATVPHCHLLPLTLIRTHVRTGTHRQVDIVSDHWFGMIFGCEALLKLIGQTPKVYFGHKANAFDFAIVMLSYVSFVADSVQLDPSTLRLVTFPCLFRIPCMYIYIYVCICI